MHILNQAINHKNKNESGISLIEILVALGIFLFVVVLVWIFIKQSYKIQNFSLNQSMAISEANRGVETMVKEIREALPGDTGAYSIENADKFELIFYTDYVSDSAIEKVRYYLQGSNFIKGVTEASGDPLQYSESDEVTSIISRYVRNTSDEPMFSYYNGDYNLLESPIDPLDVKLIHIHLKINVFPGQAPTDFNLESDAQLRNLKDNW